MAIKYFKFCMIMSVLVTLAGMAGEAHIDALAQEAYVEAIDDCEHHTDTPEAFYQCVAEIK
ncbi:hypothetical protein POP72_008 [Pectobacterium phage POP72]|uniref:Uncharacterized protein n=1 Tax=Pectobacterium phage POP72 TaxID=1965269 RepID=A0A2R2V0R4_9CAUD|nr:hypothetical protein POP72_008 [Pectobacterium phage POP72]